MANIFRQSIAYRLLFVVLIFSLLITLITTGVRLYFDYRDEISSLENDFREIEKAELQSTTASLWVMDKEQLQTQLKGILNIGHIKYASIQYKNQLIVSAGAPQTKQAMHREFPLYFTHDNRQVYIGTLSISASLKEIYEGLQSSMLKRLLYQGIQVFLINLFMFIIFQSYVTRHLITMAAYFKRKAPWESDRPLILEGYTSDDADKDEIGRVAAAINTMSTNIRNAFHELATELQKRKQAEESLQLFRKLIDQSNDAIFVIDPATSSFLDVNDKACSNLGYDRSELLSLRTIDIEAIIPDQFSWDAHVKEVKSKGYMVLEGEHKRKDGTLFPVEVNVKYMSLGEKDYMVGVARDISERKRVEAEIHAFEQRLALHYMQTPLGVIEWNLNFEVTKWNPAAETIFGYCQSEAIGSHASFIVPSSAKEHVDRIWNDLTREKGGTRSTNENIKKDGSTIFCEWYNTPLADETGNVIGVASLVQDVTERKKAEEALLQKEAELREAQRIALIGNWDWDALNDTIRWSDEYYRIYGLDPKKPAPNYVEHLKAYTPESKERLDIAVKRAMETGEPYKLDLELAQPTETTLWIIARGEAKRDANGKIRGLRGTSQNITERKQAEEEIRKLNEELEQKVIERTADLQKKSEELGESQRALMNIVEDLNRKTGELEQANVKLKELDRLKSIFIASMSHELRTPLNSIIGFSSILLNEWLGSLTAEQKDNLAVILRSGKHLLNLINDVIDVSKAEAGIFETRIEDFDIYDVISEALTAFTNDIKNKGLELKVEAVHQQMHSDRQRLLQCVLNLISNAVKFTERGSVHVQARLLGSSAKGQVPRKDVEKTKEDSSLLLATCPLPLNGDFIEISVEDTGIGIKEKDMPMLFSAFVRFESPLRAKVPGTGLGLYLTKQLVTEVLKGEIICMSKDAEGSKFTLKVPVRI